MLKPWTHKHKKTFSRKLFNNILLSARPTKRLINTAFRTKTGIKTAKVKTGIDLRTELKASHSEQVFLADSFFRR